MHWRRGQLINNNLSMLKITKNIENRMDKLLNKCMIAIIIIIIMKLYASCRRRGRSHELGVWLYNDVITLNHKSVSVSLQLIVKYWSLCTL